LLSDTGIVGLGLYLLAVFSSMKSLWGIYRCATHPMARYLSLLGLSIFPAYLVCMGFDNVLNYVLPAEQYPFALTGAAIGLQQSLKQARRSLPTDDGHSDW
jgi:hypothetical protein